MAKADIAKAGRIIIKKAYCTALERGTHTGSAESRALH